MAAVLSFLAWPATAAERYAVIVGVSEYPNLPENLWLAGPRNDAALVRDFLLTNPQAGFSAGNVTVLADGVEGAADPTLAAIRRALGDVARKAARGDFVYLHFAGHGSQQPAANPETELDGLDELFLPADIGPWNNQAGHVENALVDDEIGELIDAIRAKGAFVWAVFDSCHSGTVTRGAPADDAIRMRKLTPDALGIPEVAPAATTRGMPATGTRRPSALGDRGPGPEGAGGFVAFYAAQTTETTPEMRLPAGKAGRKPYGLFTFTLFQTLAENPGLSYRQLGQAVLQRYAAGHIPNPTPLFEGDLSATAFGSEPADEVAQWPVAKSEGGLSFAGGLLHGLDTGSLLMLLPGPAAKADEAFGYIEVDSADTMTSTARTVAHGGLDAVNPDKVPDMAYARLVEKPLDFSLTVAKPSFEGVPADARQKVEAMLGAIAPEEGSGLRLAWAEPGEAADIRLAYLAPDAAEELGLSGSAADHIWLLPPTGEIVASGTGKSPSVRLDDKSAEDAAAALQDNLTRIARATNLLRLGSAAAGAGASEVSIKLRTRHRGEKDLRDLDPASVPVLVPGDEVHILAENNGMRPVDLNVLYVGSDYSIKHMFHGRVHPQDKLPKGLLRITDGSFGGERVILVVSPAKPQTDVQDLRFLAQKAVPRTRGTPETGLMGLLRSAGFGTTTRAAVSLADEEPEETGAVIQFAIETAPSISN